MPRGTPHCHIRSSGFLRTRYVVRLGIWVKISCFRECSISRCSIYQKKSVSDTAYLCFRFLKSERKLSFFFRPGKEEEIEKRVSYDSVLCWQRFSSCVGEDRTNMEGDSEARFSCSSGCVTPLFSVCPTTMEANVKARFYANKGENYAF